MNQPADRHTAKSPADVAGQENFTINEFVLWSRLSRASIYRAIKAGNLRATKMCGRTIITRGAAESFRDAASA